MRDRRKVSPLAQYSAENGLISPWQDAHSTSACDGFRIPHRDLADCGLMQSVAL